ncbi:hypothetical protein CSHISOI_10162 [Colletotrichum shisoi]|uniref:Uncharacterized protein n=1 Tax=Colletotrichum shisoi TaxID=2078593 RepID=A0A5Q4BF92_9PEZI|nr:hypothetical protein CSHISOI_10162 [Colletotrichum shisoi]
MMLPTRRHHNIPTRQCPVPPPLPPRLRTSWNTPGRYGIGQDAL